jgi:hypothetical protein
MYGIHANVTSLVQKVKIFNFLSGTFHDGQKGTFIPELNELSTTP